MKILIIGEYSGFASNLKMGFKSLGHETILFSWGDGFKKIKSNLPEDYYVNVSNFSIYKKQIKGSWVIKNIIESFVFNQKVKTICENGLFDVVLILNLDFIRFNRQFWRPYFSMKMIKNIVKSPNDIYLSLCGNEFIYNSFLSKMSKSNPKDIIKRQKPTKREIQVFNTFSHQIPRVIPVMFDYAEPYRQYKLSKYFEIQPTIPLPLYLDNIEFNNVVRKKIVIFHGVNRESKGTSVISEALEEIKQLYSNVEIIIEGNLPFEEYLNVLKKANIIIDQCYAYSYGMNAIYSMAMGKVVLSGNEPECQIEFKREDIPIVNIKPDPQQIVRELKLLIEEPERINQIAIQSRKFVEEFHDSIIVAKQYINVFTKNNNKI